MITLLDLCVSSLRRGHANLLCSVPILTDDPRGESRTQRKRKRAPLPEVQRDVIAAQRRIAGRAEGPAFCCPLHYSLAGEEHRRAGVTAGTGGGMVWRRDEGGTGGGMVWRRDEGLRDLLVVVGRRWVFRERGEAAGRCCWASGWGPRSSGPNPVGGSGRTNPTKAHAGRKICRPSN
jgi:hypothetical protein